MMNHWIRLFIDYRLNGNRLLPRNPANATEFYPFAVHLIYAVILTLSFEIAGNVFIPFDKAFSSYDNALRSISLLLSYALLYQVA